MARRRSKPPSPIAWLLGVIISVSGSYAVYRVSVSAIKDLGQQQIKKAQAAQQRIQLQQQARQHPGAPMPALTSEQLALQQAAEQRRQAEMVAAARLRQAELEKKENAWERFYQPPSACIYPESDKRVAVCNAAESRARKQFEATWASGQLQGQR